MSKQFTVTLTLPDGKRKYYRGDTRKEAEAKRDHDKLLLLGGANLTDNTTFAELEETWYILTKENKLHARSEDTIKGIMRRYILPQLGNKKVRTMKPIDVQLLMNTVAHLSNSTQRKVLQYTKSVLDVGVDNGLLQRNPCISTIKAAGAKTEEVKPLSDEQVDILLKATEGTRAGLFCKLIIYTGLRKSEALGLMWGDIDWNNNTITVNRSVVYPDGHKEGIINPDLKTMHGRRTIPLVSEIRVALCEEFRKSKSLYVFHTKDGGYLTEASFRRLWDLVTDRMSKNKGERDFIEKPIDFDVHPHQLRHTCITRWVEAGLDIKEVQYMAGHATIDVTMEIYSHYRAEQRLKDTAAKMQNATRPVAVALQ